MYFSEMKSELRPDEYALWANRQIHKRAKNESKHAYTHTYAQTCTHENKSIAFDTICFVQVTRSSIQHAVN